MRSKEVKSLFLGQLGNTPQLRVIDFMIENHFFDFPLKEIARESHISYDSLKKFINNSIKAGIFIKTRRVKNSDYYQLNLENPFVINLIRLDWNLTKAHILSMKEDEKIFQ